MRQHAAFDPTAAYRRPVGVKGSLRRAPPALDPAQTPNTLLRYPLEIQERLKSLPGAGMQLTPRLLIAFGEQRERFAGAAEIQKYSGVTPVTQRSGNKCWIHWRWQCPTFLRQTFVEWAAQTINKSFWAGAFYRQQRDKGSSHQAAVRALAFKWLRILYRCWQTPYDESTYLNALKKRGSPLLNQLGMQT
jgi:hypothetical protein